MTGVSSPWRLWRGADLRATPWRNGGGVTFEVAIAPGPEGGHEFDWRVSVARIDSPGPFSRFDGIDRIIALIDGASMRLTVDGARHDLALLDQLAFSGEAETSCAIPDGPTRDLNVMTRRGVVEAALEFVRVRPGTQCRVEATLLVVISGRVELLATDVALGPMDGLEFAASESIALRGDAVVAAVRIRPCASR